MGAESYKRSEQRRGYANGFKPKTIQTRMGELELEIPQVRGMSFYPQTVEKGSRSERALKAAIAEMYLSGFTENVLLYPLNWLHASKILGSIALRRDIGLL